jgi:hypothetical protein
MPAAGDLPVELLELVGHARPLELGMQALDAGTQPGQELAVAD